MKRLILFLGLALFFLEGCNKNSNLADAYGNFEAIDVLVSAEGQGKLIWFDVEEGDELVAGQHVGTIDTIQLSLKIDQLAAGLRTISANVESIDAQVNSNLVQRSNLNRELDRIKNLYTDGAATRKQLEDLEGQLDLIDAQINAFESQKRAVISEQSSIEVQINQVKDQIRRAKIINPLDGVLLQKYKEQGEVVMPGQNLYKIADLSELILRAYISGSQLSEVNIGERVIVHIDGPHSLEELPGIVTWISSRSEFTPKIIQTREERVNLVYAMKVKVKNDGRLKIGMPGEVVFD